MRETACGAQFRRAAADDAGISLRRLLPAFLLVPLGLLALPATGAAQTYSVVDQQLTVTVQPRIGSAGRDQGKIPLHISWKLNPGWGVDGACFGPTTYEGEVKVTAQGETDRVVATFPITEQTGSGTVMTPVNSGYESASYLVTADFTVRRSKKPNCDNDPYGWDEVGERHTWVQVPTIYAGEDPCDWTATSSKGNVRVKRRDGRTEPLGYRDAAVAGDTIVTGRNAKIEIRSGAGDVIRIGPNSKLQLKEAYCGSKGVRRFHWKLFLGRLWTKVTKLVGPDSKFEVGGSGWGTGVRGTIFWVEARGKGRKAVFRVRTVKGAVELHSLKNPRRRVIVRAGRCASGRGNGTGRPTRPRRCRSVSQALAAGLGDPVDALRH